MTSFRMGVVLIMQSNMTDIEKAIKHFANVRDENIAVMQSGFGTKEGESDLTYRSRKLYAELAIQALQEKACNDQVKVEGRLIGLSCAIGDMVYCKTHFSKTIQGYTVGEIKINAHLISFLAMKSDGDLAFVFYPSDIGKTVFLSKNEAETALEDKQFEVWLKSQGADADKLGMATLKEIFNAMDEGDK